MNFFFFQIGENLLTREHAEIFKVQVAELIELVKEHPDVAKDRIRENLEHIALGEYFSREEKVYDRVLKFQSPQGVQTGMASFSIM